MTCNCADCDFVLKIRGDYSSGIIQRNHSVLTMSYWCKSRLLTGYQWDLTRTTFWQWRKTQPKTKVRKFFKYYISGQKAFILVYSITSPARKMNFIRLIYKFTQKLPWGVKREVLFSSICPCSAMILARLWGRESPIPHRCKGSGYKWLEISYDKKNWNVRLFKIDLWKEITK